MNELPSIQTPSRYLRTAETAKLVRAALKETFPDQKFSVISHNYTGGSSIDVSWVDGPTVASVEKITGAYAGGWLDASFDLAYGAEHWLCRKHGSAVARTYGHSYEADGGGIGNGPGASRCCARAELVHMGADYVHTHRTLSPEFRRELGMRVARECGVPGGWTEDTALPIGSAWSFGRYATVRDGVYRLSRETAR